MICDSHVWLLKQVMKTLTIDYQENIKYLVKNWFWCDDGSYGFWCFDWLKEENIYFLNTVQQIGNIICQKIVLKMNLHFSVWICVSSPFLLLTLSFLMRELYTWCFWVVLTSCEFPALTVRTMERSRWTHCVYTLQKAPCLTANADRRDETDIVWTNLLSSTIIW